MKMFSRKYEKIHFQCYTVFIKNNNNNNPHISGPTQFKLLLFKSQLIDIWPPVYLA